MIDSTGKKIVTENENIDLPFMLKEIAFFMKGFRAESSEQKALTIAKSINTYIKSKGKIKDVVEVFEELEGYITVTSSEDFAWEMVYIRREIANFHKRLIILNKYAENIFICATYFDKICEIKPTLYNYGARVKEYVLAANAYTDASLFQKADEVYEIAQNRFFSIEKGEGTGYFSAGLILFFYMHNYYLKPQVNNRELGFEALKKAAKYALALYQLEASRTNLSDLVIIYNKYVDFEQFSFLDEKENLISVVSYLENQLLLTTSLKLALKKFKSIITANSNTENK